MPTFAAPGVLASAGWSRRAGRPAPRQDGVSRFRTTLRERCGALHPLTVLAAAAGAVPTLAELTGLVDAGSALEVAAVGLLLAVAGHRRARGLSPVRGAAAREAGRYADERAEMLQQVAAEADRSRRELLAEVHDGPLQKLVLAAMALELGLEDPGGDALGRRDCEQALTAVREAIAELRAVLSGRGAHPRTPESLPAALTQIVDAHGHQFPAGVSVLCAVDRDLPGPVRRAVHLIAREAVLNAAKHADADTLTVTGAATDQTLIVSVADDGVGVNDDRLLDAAGTGHLGMSLMAERAAAVGGSVTVRPQSGGGTVVEVQVPLPAARPSSERPVRPRRVPRPSTVGGPARRATSSPLGPVRR